MLVDHALQGVYMRRRARGVVLQLRNCLCMRQEDVRLAHPVEHALLVVKELKLHAKIIELVLLGAPLAHVFLRVCELRVEPAEPVDPLLVLPCHLDVVALVLVELSVATHHLHSDGG